MYTLFKQFDIDGTDLITTDDLRKAFEHMGKPISSKEIGEILMKHDKNEEGSLNFDEFKSMLLEHV